MEPNLKTVAYAVALALSTIPREAVKAGETWEGPCPCCGTGKIIVRRNRFLGGGKVGCNNDACDVPFAIKFKCPINKAWPKQGAEHG